MYIVNDQCVMKEVFKEFVYRKITFTPIKSYRNRCLYKRSDNDYEIVRLVDGKYPTDEQFGIYGVYLSGLDRYLEEKIDFYLKNGFRKRWTYLTKQKTLDEKEQNES